MSEVFLSPWIEPERELEEPLDEGSSVFAAQFAPGLAQRQSYGGLRPKFSRLHTVRGEEKAQLIAALKATRGRYNVLRTRIHQKLRGSFPSAEAISNNTFSNGTTGFSAASAASLSVNDRVLRSTIVAQGAAGNFFLRAANVAVTQYAPYVARIMVSGAKFGTGTWHVGLRDASNNLLNSSSATSAPGLLSQSVVPFESTLTVDLRINSFAGVLAGDFANVSYVSLSRCALIDNGPNLLLQSDEFDTTWTATRASVDDQSAGTTAPDGTSTADSIIEDSSAATDHYVDQAVVISSAVGDYAFAVALKAGARTWARLLLTENVSGSASVYVNLSTGELGTVAGSGNWSNARAFVRSLGDGWYYVCLVARKISSSTNLNVRIYIAEGNGDVVFTGNGASNIYAWRATLAQSSVPTRLVQTTTAASSGTSQTGNALHVKGLPASEDGLLLPGDWFEINGELKQCTAALNSDAAGLGYLQFEPALFRSPSDNDPIIIKDPMGKFLVSNIKIDNEFGVQARVSYDIEHIYE